MFYFLSKTLDLAFAPLTWVLAGMALALVWSRQRRTLKRARRTLLASLAVLLLFSVDAVSNRLVRSLEAGAHNQRDRALTYDAVVLLGGMLDDRITATAGMPSYNERAERLTVTFELLRENTARFVIISGTSDVPEAVEADVLADQLVRFGIDPARIIREGKSRNTRENALFTKELATARGFRTLLLVTSAFHMKRAQGCFNAVGLATAAYPVDFASYDPARFGSNFTPRSNAFGTSSWALREWSGRAIYTLRHYTSDTLQTGEPR